MRSRHAQRRDQHGETAQEENSSAHREESSQENQPEGKTFVSRTRMMQRIQPAHRYL